MVNGLREAGKAAYQAALTKDQEKMIAASEVLATACANCHRKYRPEAIAKRCQ